MKFETATFGGGCFWCVEAIFAELRGVKSVVSGFSGGSIKDPSYYDVIQKDTGHAEVIQIEFDPTVISFSNLLDIFWHVHDPTTLNRQENDIGEQYRSTILYHSEKQKNIAEKSKKKLEGSGEYNKPIVTEIVPFKAFYKADASHQNYYKNNDYQPYCQFIISPKLQKFRKKYSALLQ